MDWNIVQERKKYYNLLPIMAWPNTFFATHSKFVATNILKTIFVSQYLTFNYLLKEGEAFSTIFLSDSWNNLKDKVASTYDKHGYQEVDGIMLDG